jgi:hypothetical protein
VLILGAGGHGWQALSEWLSETEAEVTISNLTSDYGGSGGVWYRLLAHNQFELPRLLTREFPSLQDFWLSPTERYPVLPWGDFNKIVAFFAAHTLGSQVANMLDFRSNDFSQHQTHIDSLLDKWPLTTSQKEQFQRYFYLSFEYFQKHTNDLDYPTDKGFCWGYPWQEFVHTLLTPHNFNNFYHNLNILPPNLHLTFTAPERQILTARDSDGYHLHGEAIIDEHQRPLLPASFDLHTLTPPISKFSQSFLRSLASADTVIIPPGSVANWLPLVNQPEIRQYLQTKPILWILNLGTQANELPSWQGYVEHMQHLGLGHTQLLTPSLSHIQELDPELHQILTDPQITVIDQLQINQSSEYQPHSVQETITELIHSS